jgi:hypothetical protein
LELLCAACSLLVTLLYTVVACGVCPDFVDLSADPTGTIRTMQINDEQVGRSVEETLRLLKAFQWADSHEGEACPASWTPGSATIKANPDGAKEYFNAHYNV